MKKKNLKTLKLNKKSISLLQNCSILGGEAPSYPPFCLRTVTCGTYTDDCQPTEHEEVCPSSWIYLCLPCEGMSTPCN